MHQAPCGTGLQFGSVHGHDVLLSIHPSAEKLLIHTVGITLQRARMIFEMAPAPAQSAHSLYPKTGFTKGQVIDYNYRCTDTRRF
jgi:hypothetical protein